MKTHNINPYIPDLVSRSVTNRAVARMLGCHESYVSHMLRKLKVIKVPAKHSNTASANKRAVAEGRRKVLAELARNLSLSASQAAELGNCSERTIQRLRHVAKKV